jgi:uncharacterized protein (DUF342 family)
MILQRMVISFSMETYTTTVYYLLELNGRLVLLTGNIYYRGNVGLGTGDPQYPIDISGRTNIRGNLIVSNDFATNGNIFFNGNIYNNGILFTGAQWTAGATSGNIYYRGNVGLGTTDPQYPIDISGRTNIRGNLIVSNDLTTNGNIFSMETYTTTVYYLLELNGRLVLLLVIFITEEMWA